MPNPYYFCSEFGTIVLMTDFGKIIKERRELLKLTQHDLAEMSGVTERTIYKIENSIGSPTIETIGRLCEILGLELIVQPRIK